MQVQVDMSAPRPFKSPSLSPVQTDLAHTLNRTVYEITTTAATTISDEDKLTLGEDAVSYSTTQYYTTVEAQSHTSSPTMLPLSPKETGNLTPISYSSKDSISSEPSHDGSTAAGGGIVQSNVCAPQTSLDGVPGSNSGGMNTVKHWTYEDQFKQLYNLSPERERKEFLDNLFSFMQKKGTPITRVPIMAKQPLDLYKLFKLVVERGGLVEVIKKKGWRNVAKELNLPASITSAAFTMRSQYVKYLYPYECEVAKLSDPQELQVAIDSNKRDRRHSETVEFIAPQIATCRSDLDQAISPVTHNVTAPHSLQLISSPTVAIPQGSIPPNYSGGFIVTPSGAHVVGSPQLLQMAHHVPGIPIVMPTSAQPYAATTDHCTRSTSDDGEDSSSQGSLESSTEPPAKRAALERSAVKVTMPENRIPFNINTASNFIMTPGGTPVVRHPASLPTSAAAPQFVQMTHPHIPIMIPASSTMTTSTTSLKSEHAARHQTIEMEQSSRDRKSLAVAVNGPVPVAAIPPQSAGSGMILSQHSSPPSLSSTNGKPQVLQVASSSGNVMLPHLVQAGSSTRREEKSTEEVGHHHPAENKTTSQKMSIANISIRSASPKSETGDHGGVDASLLVTLEINKVVYQGVLFAKPTNTAASSPAR